MALEMKKGSGGARVRFSVDTSSLVRGLRKITDKIEPEATAKGLFMAGNALLHDAIYVPPMAPKRIGNLRGSARVTKASVIGGKAQVLAGFNIVYAAKWHEVPLTRKINWTRDRGAGSPGPKYLSSKMIVYRTRYRDIIGDSLKAALQGAA